MVMKDDGRGMVMDGGVDGGGTDADVVMVM